MIDRTNEAEMTEPNQRWRVSPGWIAGVLAVVSAGLGFVAIASCGVPFVPPMSTLAVVLGITGCLTAVAYVVFAFLRKRMVSMTVLVIGGLLLTLNGFAISLGRLDKHLIDYLEGH